MKSSLRSCFLRFISFTCLFMCSVQSANILWISGLASPSHQFWSRILLKTLAERGHNITSLSVDKETNKIPNVTAIYVEGVYEFYYSKKKNLTKMDQNSAINDVIDLANFRSDSCIPAFNSEGVRRLMDYPKDFKFDLVIHDFAASHCLLGFVPRFGNPPSVGISASTCPVGLSGASGNPQFPAFIPANHLRVGYSMSFLVRVYNVFIYAFDNLVREYYMMPRQNEMARKYFGDENLDVGAISRSATFTLVNLSPADVMLPLFQTMIPVGGMQIRTPKPVDDELNSFMSKAEDGVIYFALGTNIKSEDFSSVQVKYFLDAFARFPSYRFVWKYDPALMQQALPENVMIRKWMPQNDILAHPLVKVFIGHGGALGCHEAAWYGVPQLLLPFIIDQKHNAATAVERGVALQLDHQGLTTDLIVQKLDELLHNRSFRENSDRLSRSFRDQPQSPLERAVFWVEYAIRHGTGSKLRSPGQDLGFIKQMALDVVLLYISVTIALILLVRLAAFRIVASFTSFKKIKTN